MSVVYYSLPKVKYYLRRAILKVHRLLEQLGLTTHLYKTFIGHREKVYSFPGYDLQNSELKITEVSFKKYQIKRLELQEQ